MLLVKEILSLCPHEKLLSLYKVPSFSSVDDFLQKVATLRGKLKKGGVVDVEAAAKIVLHDWNEGMGVCLIFLLVAEVGRPLFRLSLKLGTVQCTDGLTFHVLETGFTEWVKP